MYQSPINSKFSKSGILEIWIVKWFQRSSEKNYVSAKKIEYWSIEVFFSFFRILPKNCLHQIFVLFFNEKLFPPFQKMSLKVFFFWVFFSFWRSGNFENMEWQKLLFLEWHRGPSWTRLSYGYEFKSLLKVYLVYNFSVTEWGLNGSFKDFRANIRRYRNSSLNPSFIDFGFWGLSYFS